MCQIVFMCCHTGLKEAKCYEGASVLLGGSGAYTPKKKWFLDVKSCILDYFDSNTITFFCHWICLLTLAKLVGVPPLTALPYNGLKSLPFYLYHELLAHFDDIFHLCNIGSDATRICIDVTFITINIRRMLIHVFYSSRMVLNALAVIFPCYRL